MKKSILFTFALLVLSSASARIRRIEVKDDQITSVRTAIGIATIIQAPDRPNSVVVGDQDSFKVEYLDQAITIKPLHAGAKTNLYVYTDWRRYNIQLITGSESKADYVVYLENPKPPTEKKEAALWKPFQKNFKNDDLTIETTKLGILRENLVVVEFKIRSAKKVNFDPAVIWLTQNGKTKVIHNLFVSDLSISSKNPITGILQILTTDINVTEPLRIEMRRQKQSFLTLPKVESWRKLKATP